MPFLETILELVTDSKQDLFLAAVFGLFSMLFWLGTWLLRKETFEIKKKMSIHLDFLKYSPTIASLFTNRF